MRLRILEHGHGQLSRLTLRVMRALAGVEADDVVKTSLYRPAFFGLIGELRRILGPLAQTT